MGGGTAVERRGPRGGGDPSDYIDRPAEQRERGANGSSVAVAARVLQAIGADAGLTTRERQD